MRKFETTKLRQRPWPDFAKLPLIDPKTMQVLHGHVSRALSRAAKWCFKQVGMWQVGWRIVPQCDEESVRQVPLTFSSDFQVFTLLRVWIYASSSEDVLGSSFLSWFAQKYWFPLHRKVGSALPVFPSNFGLLFLRSVCVDYGLSFYLTSIKVVFWKSVFVETVEMGQLLWFSGQVSPRKCWDTLLLDLRFKSHFLSKTAVPE